MREAQAEAREGLGSLLSFITDELARKIGRIVARELRGEDPRLIDQAFSQLGRRRHIAAVRRRLAEGKPGASVVGRRFLLSQEAHAEELGRLQPPPQTSAPEPRGPGIRKARPRPRPVDLEPEAELEDALKRAGLRN
jgi:hypothetical protein